MARVHVALENNSYDIEITSGALSRVGKTVGELCSPTSIAVITNPVVAKHYSSVVSDSLAHAGFSGEVLTLQAGERYKTLKQMSRIYDALANWKIDRKGLIIALGGGVVGDMAGFAAATYLRGIDYIQVPTTLLAQVDSSIGGKTGVDLPQGKNLVGAFYQPKHVLIDIDTLGTLPARELRCGLAEVIKHGIIFDQAFYRYLSDNTALLRRRVPDTYQYAVERSVEIKREVVQKDERESGLRAILNYGHTIGHGIETVAGYGRLKHGEAVAIGMVCECVLAEVCGICEDGTSQMIADICKETGLPFAFPENIDASDVLGAMAHDKKALGGKIRFALPTAIGHCDVFSDIDSKTIEKAISKHISVYK